MNESSFDDLARGLALAASRRGILKALVAASTGSLLSGAAPGHAFGWDLQPRQHLRPLLH
jgi:hypothetical protein